MKRYDNYKDSGVQWIGEIPSHWEVCRVKHRYNIVTGFTPDTKRLDFYDESNGETWVTIADISGKFIDDSSKYISEKYIKEFSPQKVVKGSLLYSFKLSVGQVAFASKDLYTNEAIASFLDTNTVCLPFMYYAAPLFIIENANTNIYGAKILNQDLINNAFTVFPPLEEQKAIAKWLDVKCGEIDKLIATQQRRIDLLQELRQSIITRAVTQGINPDAPLRDSGIDWIGQIPTHWDSCRLKFILHLLNGRAYAQNELLEEGKYKVLRVGNFFTNSQWYYSDLELEPDKYCHKGDLLYAWSASFGPYIWDEDNTIYHYHIWKVLLSEQYEKKYAYYVLDAISNFKRGDVHGSTMTHITMDSMNNSVIPLPPLDEQREIVAHIERETAKVDHALQQAERQIELLQELRQSVITEVVTGKRKVC